MTELPSSTFFTQAPHWQWYIVFYFFLGGLAAGSYFIAAMIDLFGRAGDRPLARLGYYVAFPLVSICGVLLILDLNRPLRFWHMLIERNTFAPMFKYWSPMSVGAWALLIFGFFTFVSFLAALADDDRARREWPLVRRLSLPWQLFARLRPPSLPGIVVAVLGGLAGFYIAGYTGVLLAVTNRPIWADTTLLGMLFLVSAASTSAALMMLLAGHAASDTPGVKGLKRMDEWIIALEAVVLAAVVISLGPVLVAWLNAWGLLLVVGVVIPGLAVPLLASRRPSIVPLSVSTVSLLVLLGGFLLRVVVVMSSESV